MVIDEQSSLFFWQQRPWQLVNTLISKQSLPHALLFQGPVGLGKAKFAEALAHSLLCSAPNNNQACRRCKACQLITAATHPDLLLLPPILEEKTLKIASVRQITDFLYQTTQYQGYKIVIIPEAERLNRAASNALLKTLEEPPPQSLLILTSAYPQHLLATIRSRCQLIQFTIPDFAAASMWVGQQLSEKNWDPAILLNLAAGAPLQALELATSDLLSQRQALFSDFKALSSQQITLSQCSEKWQKYEPLWVFDTLITWVMDMVHLQFSLVILNADFETDLYQWAQCTTFTKLWAFYQQLLQEKASVVHAANLNKQLSVDYVLSLWLTKVLA